MKSARSATAVIEVQAPVKSRLLPPIDDELRFDFELEPFPEPKPVGVGWLKEGADVKAAILRWLEEQA